MEDFDLYREDLKFNEGALPGIVADANRLLELQEELKKLEEKVKSVKEQIQKLTWELIPDKLKDAGVQSIKLPSGWTVDVKFKVMGSLPKGTKDPQRRVLAIDALRSLGGDEIIKNTLTVVLDRGFDNLAADVIATLEAQFGLHPELQEDVNAMTLQAWARRQLEEVEDVGAFITKAETVGLFIGNEAKVKKE